MNPFEFPDRVEFFCDGKYCWTYDTRAHHNSDMFLHWLKVVLIATLPLTLGAVVAGLYSHPVMGAVAGGGMLALMALIQAAIWKVFHHCLDYRMGEEEIEFWPKRRRDDGLYRFGDARRVRCYPDKDLIVLKYTFESLRVYIPREDYEFVQEYIRARTPDADFVK